MSERPYWDNQFAETESERNERLATQRKARLVYNKTRRTIIDPRDPDHSREGIFVLHNCSRCKDGALPCVHGEPRQCEFPHARND